MSGSTIPGAYHGGNHYENFPTGSWLIPRNIRPAVIALYQFARLADDLADEGSLSPQDRQTGLAAIRSDLLSPSEKGSPAQRLAHELFVRGIGLDDAHALLDAFFQDTLSQPMADEAAVLSYCQQSANPVGRLILRLAGLSPQNAVGQKAFCLSDAICTGLQLANFAQDLGQDLKRGRIYIPKTWWPEGKDPCAQLELLTRQAKVELTLRMAGWAKTSLDNGSALPGILRQSVPTAGLRLAIEIGATLAGGYEIIRIISKDPLAVWNQSPEIKRYRIVLLIMRGIRYALKNDA